MKLNSIPALLMTAGLTIAVIACDRKEGEKGTAEETRSAIDVIHDRSSIRSYSDRKVTRKQLETIVRAGMAAPSATNKQPWQFVIVDEKEILMALGEDLPTSRMEQGAPAAIIVCGDLELTAADWLQQYWIQDCSAVSQNILLAITDLGLGGVWTSVYPSENRMEIVSGILELPEHIIPLNIIPVGYPDEKSAPKDKWMPEKVHWNKW